MALKIGIIFLVLILVLLTFLLSNTSEGFQAYDRDANLEDLRYLMGLGLRPEYNDSYRDQLALYAANHNGADFRTSADALGYRTRPPAQPSAPNTNTSEAASGPSDQNIRDILNVANASYSKINYIDTKVTDIDTKVAGVQQQGQSIFQTIANIPSIIKEQLGNIFSGSPAVSTVTTNNMGNVSMNNQLVGSNIGSPLPPSAPLNTSLNQGDIMREFAQRYPELMSQIRLLPQNSTWNTDFNRFLVDNRNITTSDLELFIRNWLAVNTPRPSNDSGTPFNAASNVLSNIFQPTAPKDASDTPFNAASNVFISELLGSNVLSNIFQPTPPQELSDTLLNAESPANQLLGSNVLSNLLLGSNILNPPQVQLSNVVNSVRAGFTPLQQRLYNDLRSNDIQLFNELKRRIDYESLNQKFLDDINSFTQGNPNPTETQFVAFVIGWVNSNGLPPPPPDAGGPNNSPFTSAEEAVFREFTQSNTELMRQLEPYISPGSPGLFGAELIAFSQQNPNFTVSDVTAFVTNFLANPPAVFMPSQSQQSVIQEFQGTNQQLAGPVETLIRTVPNSLAVLNSNLISLAQGNSNFTASQYGDVIQNWIIANTPTNNTGGGGNAPPESFTNRRKKIYQDFSSRFNLMPNEYAPAL